MRIQICKTLIIINSILLLASCGIEDTVKFNGRAYEGSTIYTEKEFNQKYGQVEAVGKKVIGMEIMMSEEGQKITEEQNTVPTLLFLKKNEKEYVVYRLQGGT
ncbi:hypothetical protein [Thalassobacillus pellis]|uniref:hypothetical protein n=1 Tax=Thalassobacillus pellis TaxID=748008 RepID=UPI00195FD7D2|nr:hypothetical protein [Thalassobacillus pellis]MBM7554435.1 hypothetical protein [Thalassobacillus pellis]